VMSWMKMISSGLRMIMRVGDGHGHLVHLDRGVIA